MPLTLHHLHHGGGNDIPSVWRAGVPGSDIDLDNPDPGNVPALVSPAVLYMAGTEAPNGRIIQAGNGRFASDMVYANSGISLGADLSADDFIDAADDALDMTDAEPKTTFWR